MAKMTEQEAYEQYDDMLNELYPLEGYACNAFSILLANGDPIAYNCGFSDYCDSQEIELLGGD